MTYRTVSLVQNLPVALQGFTVEQLYLLAQGLGNELARRGLDALLEARALELALLVPAQQEHRAIFSADCLTASDIHVDAGQRQVSELPARPPSDYR
jgi:hypothetical protein